MFAVAQALTSHMHDWIERSPSFIAEPSSVSEYSSVEKANQYCDSLRTVLDKHAPPSLRKIINHNSSTWFESIRDELFIAKRERRQADRKWRNTKITIFKDLYRQAKHKVSKLVHTAKCKFYTEGIALPSSSKELHQIVNTLSNRHPPKILPTIYPSADLPCIFMKHYTNKVEKPRVNIDSEHVTSTLVTGTTAATVSSFEKVSQLTVKECILNSAPILSGGADICNCKSSANEWRIVWVGIGRQMLDIHG